LKLNLGCSDAFQEGFLNVDICYPRIIPLGMEFQRADLTKPWPWVAGEVDHIRAHDIVEHLPNKIGTMNEAWRVLKPGGLIEIVVPTTDGHGADQDPQHCAKWNIGSFQYFVDDPRWPAESLHRQRFGQDYGIRCTFLMRHAEVNDYDAVVFGLPSHVPKLTVVLEAVK
jgi:SAM-dependent methyltransferase